MATLPVTLVGGPGTPAMSASSRGGSSSRSSSKGPSSELNAAIRQLQGIFESNAALRTERAAETDVLQAMRTGYSREQAFTDAQGLMQQQMERVMAEAMPSINRGAEGAGASAGSMRALLAQNAAESAAQSAAALGAEQAVQYGNISNGTSGVIEALTRTDDASLSALMNALQIQQQARTAASSSSSSVSRQASAPTTSKPTVQIGASRTTTAPKVVGALMPYETTYEGLAPGGSHIQAHDNFLGGITGFGPTATNKELMEAYTNLLNTTPGTSQSSVSAGLDSNILNTGLRF